MAGSYEVRPPRTDEFGQVFDLRYLVLDQPVGLPHKEHPGEHDADPRSIHMAAFVGETIVSTVRLDELPEDTFLVRRMATDPSFQGRGIGAAVLTEAERVAREERAAKHMVLHARMGAVGFYEKLGYRQTGKIEYHHTDPNPEMAKDFAS